MPKKWRLVIIFTLLIVCGWVVIKSNKLSSRVVAYEQEYAIDARLQLSEWLSLIEQGRTLKATACESIPVEIRTTEELFYCGKN
jgi:hypothetical protein